MSLSKTACNKPTSTVTREELHFRRIDMRGYQRSDGLYEVEGRVIDRKTNEFSHPGNGGKTVPAGEPLHDMGIRLVFDDNMVVHDVETFTDTAPYPACQDGGRALQAIKGLRIAAGWSREVRARLRGAHSCIHLMEILIPMATVAFQSLGALRLQEPEKLDAQGRPLKINSCYAYSADGEIVRHSWPQFYRP